MSGPLLNVQGLEKYFTVGNGSHKQTLKAVDSVNLVVYPGETVGLVGESGCGKSTLGRTILGLEKATEGFINFAGKNLVKLSPKEMRPLRKQMQIIFQDPYAALNPREQIFDLVKAPLDAFSDLPEEEKRKQVADMLKFVGIGEYHFEKYPYELSGGQRQRVVIARAMILHPSFVVCDEAVSALDVSIKAQILNLMKDLQEKTGVAYLFISHDMSVVRYLCDKIAVMYLGRIVEFGTKQEIFSHPFHPYTRALLSAVPVPDPDYKVNRIILKGDVPSPLHMPSGCRFHTRCPMARAECAQNNDLFMHEVTPGHFVACPFAGIAEESH